VNQSLTIEVPGTRDSIALASAQAEEWLQSHHPSAQALNLLLIAIEELVINCVDYGYDDDKTHTIRLVLAIDGENLIITVIDDGHPFDPLSALPPDLSLPVQARPVGGLGIHLLRQLSDQITYQRRDRFNELTITKRLA
jgi:anti-sigma regulatory factor (Ser/Thr protein kinase)